MLLEIGNGGNAALQQIDVSKYTHTVVLDADNVLKEDFLMQVDSVLNPSMLALQTHRTAKNKNCRTQRE